MVLLGIFAGVFLICCWLVVNKRIDKVDQAFSQWVIQHRKRWLTKMFHFFTALGKGLPSVCICLLLWLAPSKDEIALPVTISILFAGGSSRLLKPWIARTRPRESRLVEESDFSFPSAHALGSAALYGGVAFHAVAIFPIYGTLLFVVCFFLVFLIGFSRIYLGIHYASDVVGGWALGLFFAMLTYLFL